MDPRGTFGRICKEDHYTLLHTKYESSGPCGLGEEDFFMFFPFPIVCLWELMTPGEGPFLTPGTWLAGFIKKTTTHCYIQNIKALGFVVLEKKIFLCFSHDAPGAGHLMDPRGTFSKIYKEDHYTLLHTKYERSGPCGFGEKDFFYVFPHDAPGVGPIWTPGAPLAGFIKRTTIHCYTQYMKALGLVISEKKIFLCFSHCMSMGANDSWGGAIFDPRGMVGRIYKENHYTLLHTKYESSGPCGFGEEDFLCFSHDAPGAGPVWTSGAWLAGFIKRTIIHIATHKI